MVLQFATDILSCMCNHITTVWDNIEEHTR